LDALEKLGVEVHVFCVGEYKSAVEPFTRRNMSAEANVADAGRLQDLWGGHRRVVAGPRKLEADAVNRYVSGFTQAITAAKGDAAKLALDAGLVNRLETLAQFRSRIAEVVGEDKEHGSFRQIHFREYLKVVEQE